MKITDVSLTLFAWDDIPPTQYGQHSRFAGSSALGLLRIATDDGKEFLIKRGFRYIEKSAMDIRDLGKRRSKREKPE